MKEVCVVLSLSALTPVFLFVTCIHSHPFDISIVTLQLERGKKLQEQLDAAKRELTVVRKQGEPFLSGFFVFLSRALINLITCFLFSL